MEPDYQAIVKESAAEALTDLDEVEEELEAEQLFIVTEQQSGSNYRALLSTDAVDGYYVEAFYDGESDKTTTSIFRKID